MRTSRFTCVHLLIIVLCFLATATPLHAEPTVLPHPLVVGQIGGVAKTMAFNGDYVFFNIGPRIARMLISSADPAHPTAPPLYSDILPGVPEDIKYAHGYLYVAMGEAGLAIIDPNTLGLLDTEELPEDTLGIGFAFELFASDLAVGSRYLYVATGRAGILAYDLGASKNTMTFVQVKTFLTPLRNITDVEVQPASSLNNNRELLFAAANNFAATPALRGGVLMYDITTTPGLGLPAHIREQIEVNALATAGGHLYAAGQTVLYVLATTDLTVESGDFLLANPPIDIALSPTGAAAYLVNTSGIDVVDLSTPTTPVALTPTPVTTPGAAQRLQARSFADSDDTFLFIADFDAGLTIARSTALGEIDVVSPAYVVSDLPLGRTVAPLQGQAYAAGVVPRLLTINSSFPGRLRFIGGGVDTPTVLNALSVRDAWLVAVAGTTGLLRFATVQGTQPEAPERFTTGGNAVDLAVVWPNAIVADGANGLVLVNLDGPLALTGSANGPQFNSNFRAVDATDTHAYVVDGNGTFRIYDITDPTGPIPRGVLPLTGMLDVAVYGNFAFVACGEDGLRVIDVTDPTAPAFVGTEFYEVGGLAQSLTVDQDMLYVAAAEAGVHILAIQPDGQLFPVRTLAIPGNATQSAMGRDGYLYIAAGEAGIVMVQFDDFRIFMPIISHDLLRYRYLPLVGKS